MYPRGSSKVLFLVAFALLAALLAGCGGTEQSGNGAQGGAPDGQKQDGGGVEKGNKKRGGAQKKAAAAKVALGTIESVWPKRRRVELKPTAEKKNAKVMIFKIRRKAEIMLEGKEAQLTDARKGQQVQIRYVTVKKKRKKQEDQADKQEQLRTVNWARSMQLFKRGGGE